MRAKYVGIIDEMLAHADLAQITSKEIRNAIQERVEYDITPQKHVIKRLIMERFDILDAKQNPDTAPIPSVERGESQATTNGHVKSESRSSSHTVQKREAEDSEPSDVADAPPPKKKRRDSIDDDAAYAAKLQAELNQAARSTRGGASRKSAPVKKKKTPKKKTAARVTGSDDSDVADGDEGKTRKVNRNTGFHKPMNLSSTAADFFGTTQVRLQALAFRCVCI